MSLFIKKYFPSITLKFWPFCTPPHKRTWWLSWELGKVTRSYLWKVCVLLWLGRNQFFIISFRVTSLALGQSYDCPSASEATLKDMEKQITCNQNKAKHNTTVHRLNLTSGSIWPWHPNVSQIKISNRKQRLHSHYIILTISYCIM